MESKKTEEEIILKVEWLDNYRVMLTNSSGDTYTSKSEELQDFLYRAKPIDAAQFKAEQCAGVCESLLHGFINAYDVLNYNINPDLVERAKKYLESQQQLQHVPYQSQPQQSSLSDEDVRQKILDVMVDKLTAQYDSLMSSKENRHIARILGMEDAAEEIEKLFN